MKKANWEEFTTLCQEQLTPEKFKKAEDMSAFTSALHDISEKCIPKSSTRSKRRNPWYNDECKMQLTNANRHYETLIRIRLVKIICIPN